MPTRHPRLIVLPPSHYCERARWALDHAGVAYTEDRWGVGLHVPLAKRLMAGTGLPILDTGAEIIQGSDRILDWTGLPGRHDPRRAVAEDAACVPEGGDQAAALDYLRAIYGAEITTVPALTGAATAQAAAE